MDKTSTTIAEVIGRVDAIKPNVFSIAQKVEWLNKVETMIQTEILDVPVDELVVYSPADTKKALIVELPYRDVYDYYLMAMIDFMGNDIASYQNSMTMFNTVFDSVAKALRKKNSVYNRFKNWW